MARPSAQINSAQLRKYGGITDWFDLCVKTQVCVYSVAMCVYTCVYNIRVRAKEKEREVILIIIIDPPNLCMLLQLKTYLCCVINQFQCQFQYLTRYTDLL